MISMTVDRKIIDELIWGNIDSEFIEAKFPLSISYEVSVNAKENVWNLFVGFLYFIHYRCGLMPKLGVNGRVGFEELEENFADRSSWVEFMINRSHA